MLPRDREPARDPQGVQFELAKFREAHKVLEKDGGRWDVGFGAGVGGDVGDDGAVGAGLDVEGEDGEGVVGSEEVLADGEGVQIRQGGQPARDRSREGVGFEVEGAEVCPAGTGRRETS